MLAILYSLNSVLMIALPIALGVVLVKATRASWGLFAIGAVTFIASQVVHLPLNAGLTELFKSLWPDATPQPWHIPFNAIVLGLTAGLCEEVARYLCYRFLAPGARAFRDGLMVGAGHGGIEAIIIGLLTGYTFIQMASLRQTGLEGLGLSATQIELAQQQLNAYWSIPPYVAILGAVERVFAMALHVGMSVVVLQVFVRRQWRWLILAIAYHAFADAVTVFAVQLHWQALVIEALVGIVALGSLGMLWLLRPREGLIPIEPEPELIPGSSTPPPPAARRQELARGSIDDSRFT